MLTNEVIATDVVRNVGGNYLSTADIERLTRSSTCINAGVTRLLFQPVDQNIDCERTFFMSYDINCDLSRGTVLDRQEVINVDTLRYPRNKPLYRYVSNHGEPFTFPDGTPMCGLVLRFILVDTNGQPEAVVDYETGDSVNNYTEVTTDMFGEFGTRLWPTNKGTEQMFYMLTTNSHFIKTGKLYLPKSNFEIKFSKMYKNMDSVFEDNDYDALPFTLSVPSTEALPFNLAVMQDNVDSDLPFSLSAQVWHIGSDDSLGFSVQPSFADTAAIPMSITPVIHDGSTISFSIQPQLVNDSEVQFSVQPKFKVSNNMQFNVNVVGFDSSSVPFSLSPSFNSDGMLLFDLTANKQ